MRADAGEEDAGEAPVAVLGLGNVLMQDDALGPYVVRTLLASHEFGEGVSVIDAGTPGLDLTPFLLGRRAVIVVDTVKGEGPGTLRLVRRDELLATAPGPRTSPHDPGLKEAMLLLEFRGDAPEEFLLVGVVPGEVGTGTGLTPAVREAVPRAAAAVIEELGRLGHPPRPASVPGDPDIWWERPPDEQVSP